jgi:hypothetical protein
MNLTNTYRESLVVYIDILGFREMIEESRKAVSKVQEILELLKAIKSEFAAHGRVHRTDAGKIIKIFSSHDFSDLVVRCTEIPSGAPVGDYIDSEIFHLGYKQVFLVIEGVLIRGGMCIGEMLVANEGIVFGPALVKAYDLESKYAVYPRIVIDRDLVHKAEREGYISSWRDWVQRGEDGAYYLDYLFGSSLTGFVIPDSPKTYDLLLRHQRMIEDSIKGMNRRDERVKQKLIWLALYHNSVIARLCERVPKYSKDLRDFLLPEGVLEF